MFHLHKNDESPQQDGVCFWEETPLQVVYDFQVYQNSHIIATVIITYLCVLYSYKCKCLQLQCWLANHTGSALAKTNVIQLLECCQPKQIQLSNRFQQQSDKKKLQSSFFPIFIVSVVRYLILTRTGLATLHSITDRYSN